MRRAAVAGWSCLLVTLAGFGGVPSSDGQVQATTVIVDTKPAKETAKPKIVFAPDVEAKFTEFIKKTAEAKRKLWGEEMAKEVEEVQKATDLSGDPVKVLQAAAQQAVESSLPAGTAKLDEIMRRGYSQVPAGQMSAALDQMLTAAAAFAAEDWPGGTVTPTEQTVWTDALRHTLSPEQLIAWQKTADARESTADKEISGYLNAQVDRNRDQCRRAMLAKSHGIARELAWPPERTAKLDALGREAADQSAQGSREATRKMLLAMSEVQRRQLIKNQGFFSSNEEDNQPEKQPVWRDGLEKLLTADEQKVLQTVEEEHHRNRARVSGQLLLALLDRKIAFTVSQREKLQPLAERLMEKDTSLFQEVSPGSYIGYNLSSFYAQAAAATSAELGTILDPAQCKHWQELGPQTDEDESNGRVTFSGRAKPVAAATPSPPPGEPEEVEQNISDYFYPKAERERQRLVASMLLQAEDVTRIDALPAEVSSRLQTAAMGAAEEAWNDWKGFVEQNVRAQLQDVTPQNIKVRLESVQDYSYQQFRTAPDKTDLWKQTVETELTAPQRSAWQAEVDARNLYHNNAIAAFVAAEFDRQYPLTGEQRAKLVPLIAGILQEYSSDIARMFSYNGDQSPWYLQGYSMFLPLVGAPENDLKAILTPEQMQQWTGSQECNNASSYWSSIESMHNQGRKRPQVKS